MRVISIISAFVHGALIAAAVALTLPNRGDASVQEKVRGPEVTYVAVKSVPPHRSTAAPRRAERMPVRTLPQLPAVVDFKRADVIPKVLGNAPSPRYPSALRASGLSGRVVL